MGYAFISYSSKNQSVAQSLKKHLSDCGVQIWMAPEDIPAGSSYMKEINQAIKNCSCFVLLLSRESQSSQWVIKELERAVSYGKDVFPVLIDDVKLNDEFEFALCNYQIISVKKLDINDYEVEQLIRRIMLKTKYSNNNTPAASTVGRYSMKHPDPNDPCPCGSGKKYKKCCGAPGKQS